MDLASQRIRDKLWYGILPDVAPVKTGPATGPGGSGMEPADGLGRHSDEHSAPTRKSRRRANEGLCLRLPPRSPPR